MGRDVAGQLRGWNSRLRAAIPSGAGSCPPSDGAETSSATFRTSPASPIHPGQPESHNSHRIPLQEEKKKDTRVHTRHSTTTPPLLPFLDTQPKLHRLACHSNDRLGLVNDGYVLKFYEAAHQSVLQTRPRPFINRGEEGKLKGRSLCAGIILVLSHCKARLTL